MIKKIGKITIYVNNQEEAKAFWTEKLNFVIKLEQPMGPNMTWLEVGPNECEFTTFILYDKFPFNSISKLVKFFQEWVSYLCFIAQTC